MKQSILLFFICFSIVCTSCSPRENDNQTETIRHTSIEQGQKIDAINSVRGQGRYLKLSRVGSLIRDDNSIIVGHPTQSFINRTHLYTTHDRPFDPLDRDTATYLKEAWSQGSVVVDRVLYRRPNDSIAVGQTIQFAEPVGLITDNGLVIKTITNDCTEIKQNSTYVLVLDRHNNDGVYWLVNLNNGRFNTDGRDIEDEFGGSIRYDGTKTDKQKLREELTAIYGVTFTVTVVNPDNKVSAGKPFAVQSISTLPPITTIGAALLRCGTYSSNGR